MEKISAKLTEKPTIWIVGGIAVLVSLLIGIGIGTLIFQPTVTSASTQHASPTPTSVAARSNSNPYTIYIQQYGDDIRSQIAQGLHLTPDQVAAQLKSGKSLNDIATAQSISATQMQTIVTNAFDNGLKPAVDAGGLTQKQVDALVKRMLKNPKQLANFLGGGKSKPKLTPTPTVPSA